jgi:hypothetical protein
MKSVIKYKYCIREEGDEVCLLFESNLDVGIYVAEQIADKEWKNGRLKEDHSFTFDLFDDEGELIGTFCIESCNDGSPKQFIAKQLNNGRC